MSEQMGYGGLIAVVIAMVTALSSPVYFCWWFCAIKPLRELLIRPPKDDETNNFPEFTVFLVFG